ncbi:hypothetical protein PHYBLDRAFT_61323 [Phycomyces blakesleeanus NRRL 1555(-)]|uniref:Uncharacterized protein n=1 Tax=Phycomyces blakesleeanus (strain ATCC 8743b / DSM 1359 / FGSC 10004 / NBRC 33097 / NRRL 1555) TaxID=763407 RepID=A0A163E0X5_PHYB8|nr:hypothetical protein PHYBLDRAFT_61323 [Phycomyces blakesleeanus NRRL 1555(-)]OAD74620.1 hypothetical protein PHYBLDRAFT_61323 [Phycomyces blakesleeanus NRRL 1555(-)]|eukprot:XP_018292660.1 hypothetical protein PHYBLDRAFT_61323 [Phycomyces blakesleeanus NRRL 1555(-)]
MSFSKFCQSAKDTFQRKGRKSSKSESCKSVRFQSESGAVFYTHSSEDYDRRSSFSTMLDEQSEPELVAEMLKHAACGDQLSEMTQQDEEAFVLKLDEEVIRNTLVNRKQGYHSIAALYHYYLVYRCVLEVGRVEEV